MDSGERGQRNRGPGHNLLARRIPAGARGAIDWSDLCSGVRGTRPDGAQRLGCGDCPMACVASSFAAHEVAHMSAGDCAGSPGHLDVGNDPQYLVVPQSRYGNNSTRRDE